MKHLYYQCPKLIWQRYRSGNLRMMMMVTMVMMIVMTVMIIIVGIVMMMRSSSSHDFLHIKFIHFVHSSITYPKNKGSSYDALSCCCPVEHFHKELEAQTRINRRGMVDNLFQSIAFETFNCKYSPRCGNVNLKPY